MASDRWPTAMKHNSLDALRLLAEPWFLGLNTVGTTGVSIFFFLSGFLVWTSWARDPDIKRFFWRRSLRIFPALWGVTLASVFVLGPAVSVLSVDDYFAASQTWQYLRTAVLVSPNTLPGLFPANALPYVVNGSLWTLPIEYLCYVTVVMVGLAMTAVKVPRNTALAGAVLGIALLASFGSRVVGERFAPHLEMVALFWWGVFYGHCRQAVPGRWAVGLSTVAFLIFAWFGPRGAERAAMLVCAALMVHAAMGLPGLLAYASWHLVEKRALRFKPVGVSA